jgi:glycosyltransferase involved in cell wall biosynthesis
MISNFIWALQQAKGKYIALCEGDDYWTDPLKLQKQVDFLEENEEYIMCFTNVNDVDEKGNIIKEKKLFYKKDTFEHIDMPFLAPTLTRVMRNKHLNELNWPNVKGGDNFLLTYHSKFGKTKFMDIVTAHYRLHDGGVYSSLIVEEKFLHAISTRVACLGIADYPLKLKLYQKILYNCLYLGAMQSKQYFNIAITETKVSLQAETKNLKKEDIFKIKKVLFLLKIYSFFKFHKFRKYIKKSIMFN